MKDVIIVMGAFMILLSITYSQAENNRQLMYELNVSQTSNLILDDTVDRLTLRVSELEGYEQATNECIKATK